MKTTIAELLHEKEILISRLNKMVYGSIEIRSNNEKNSSNKLSNLSSSSSNIEPISSSIISSSTNKNSVNSSSSIYNEPVEKEVNTPTLMLDEITGVVSWNFDENATHYNYIINDGEIKTTTSNNIKLNDKKFEVLFCNLTTKKDIVKSLIYLTTNDITKVPGFYFHKTDRLHITFPDKLKKPWCLDGEKFDSNISDYVVEIVQNVPIMIPKKVIPKLFVSGVDKSD